MGCQTVQEKDESSKVPDSLSLSDAKTQLDSLNYFAKKAYSDPLAYSEYTRLFRERFTAYTLGADALPDFIDPIFNASEMYSYLEQLETAGYDGIRVYPCLAASNEITVAFCGAKFADASEDSYKLIENYDYTHIPNAINSIVSTREQVIEAHTGYLTNVKIYGLTQPAYGVTNDAYRKSRYYSISSIKELMVDNIPDLVLDDTPDFKDFKIRLETGFVPMGLIDVLNGRCGGTNSPLHQFGYTAIWKILNDKRASTLNPNAKFTNCDEYNNRALEVGHPCPPRCGVLHQ